MTRRDKIEHIKAIMRGDRVKDNSIIMPYTLSNGKYSYKDREYTKEGLEQRYPNRVIWYDIVEGIKAILDD